MMRECEPQPMAVAASWGRFRICGRCSQLLQQIRHDTPLPCCSCWRANNPECNRYRVALPPTPTSYFAEIALTVLSAPIRTVDVEPRGYRDPHFPDSRLLRLVDQ